MSIATIGEAQAAIRANVKVQPVALVSLEDALGRTLAQEVLCDSDYPPFDRALMDGFAVRSQDLDRAGVTLEVVGQARAGFDVETPVGVGQAMQINTGAPLPPGADAVVKVEDTEILADGAEVLVEVTVDEGNFVGSRGACAVRGSVAISSGTVLTAGELSVAATCGASELSVYRKPRVGILVTGDEVVSVGATPRAGQIRDTNSHLLRALVQDAGGDPEMLGTVVDDRAALLARVREGLESDVLCITGGVSMGAFDFVPGVLEELGCQIYFRKLPIKPGKPIHFATSENGTSVFALPGNPVSVLVGFELFVRAGLAAMEGRDCEHVTVTARLEGGIRATGDRRTFLPARVRADGRGGYEAKALSWQGSGDPFGLVGANALIDRPAHADAGKAGESVSIRLLRRL